jgi:DNA repair protein RecN (Recombination protein N)
MLQTLHIENYALIRETDIAFGDGFVAVTGETGAGKSIMLGALGLLLGQRADSKAIKQGTTKCTIEAHFDLTKYDMGPFFQENDIDYDPASLRPSALHLDAEIDDACGYYAKLQSECVY